MNLIKKFELERENFIKSLIKNKKLKQLTLKWIEESAKSNYSYNFNWLGRPIIQYPQDIVAIQEIIWKVKPDVIIETGIAHGGSLILSASILEIIGKGKVIGIDIDIRRHNRSQIEKHILNKRITMIEGSSIDKKIAKKIYKITKNKKKILVILDSNHTHEHVLKELELYSPLVTKNSYLVIFDTIIEDMPKNFFNNRSWGKGNNPKTAVWEFLKTNKRFKIDIEIENKLLITVAPNGYLKCIKD
jgi:cephalosporin hydroxylase